MHRLGVSGGRDLPEAETVWIPLWLALHEHRALVLTYGDNPSGADRFVHEWFDLPEQTFNRRRRNYEPSMEFLVIRDRCEADWTRGKIAGNIRNQVMIDRGLDLLYAFPTPKSKGTLDCMARAWVRGVPVRIYHHLEINQWRMLEDCEGERLARQRLGWGR
jgi:hypothetical protein